MIDTESLNKDQKEAVLSDDPHMRVIAGAGSGKTRVLTMRIAHLIEDEDVRENRILAITFTNKAANEMKERIRKMLGERVREPWISTIHSLCVRILREDITVLGYPRNFTIMDAEDQKAILKEAYKQMNLEVSNYPYSAMLDYISTTRRKASALNMQRRLPAPYLEEKVKADVYEYYINRLQALYALDFDDLITWTVRMFAKFDEVLTKWQRRFEYILVDEFQDIDNVQYKLIRYLAGSQNSLYVVGDPDQTIYTWRGANVDIIMNFTKDYPDTKTVILNENYRSTEAILNGANSVIKNNRHRVKKDLFTNRKSDEKITHYASASDEYQAAWIAEKIAELHRKGKSYTDIAILYRSNYLSRNLEKAMLDMRIPYIIYGGIRFYERQEVKDALCYLRMVTTADDLALGRILNRPKRGIGNKTMDAIAEEARKSRVSMYEVLKRNEIFSGKNKKTIESFVAMVESWREAAANGMEIFRLFEKIIDDSGYRAMLEENKETDRIENIKELIDDVREFSETYPESTLDEYMQLVSLYGDRDETMSSEYVRLMTVHAAKGLEFDTVFVSDMNDGIFPNERAMNDSGSRGVEEERRLAYVAFTRARNKLYLTEAGGFSYILQRARTSSRFIREIDPEYIEHIGADSRTGHKEVQLSSALFDSNPGTFAQRIHETNTAQLKKGELVTHSKFGEGVVISCKNGIAEIAFPYPYGVKKIAAGHPSIKRKSQMRS